MTGCGPTGGSLRVRRGQEGRITKEHRGLGGDGDFHDHGYGDGFRGVCSMSEILKLCIWNTGSLLYVDHTSIKLIFTNKKNIQWREKIYSVKKHSNSVNAWDPPCPRCVSRSQPDLRKDGAGANATLDDLDPNMRSLLGGERPSSQSSQHQKSRSSEKKPCQGSYPKDTADVHLQEQKCRYITSHFSRSMTAANKITPKQILPHTCALHLFCSELVYSASKHGERAWEWIVPMG